MLFSGEQSLMLEDGRFALLLMCSFIQQTLSVSSERGTLSSSLHVSFTAVTITAFPHFSKVPDPNISRLMANEDPLSRSRSVPFSHDLTE